MDVLQQKLCDIQGRLFELFADTEYDEESLAKAFMCGEIAQNLDSEYNRMQWAGEEYLLEELIATCRDKLAPKHAAYDSAKIYKQATLRTMSTNYLMFHTFDPSLAVDDLKEIHEQRAKR